MKPILIILGIGTVAVVVIVAAILLLGIVELPDFNIPGDDDLDPDDEEAPPGAAYCDYTDMQILDMIETVTGKDLDNSVGISYVRALNMQACGSNDENALDISAYYKSLYIDWYISDDAVDSGSGWTAYRIVWLNAPDASATLAKAVMIGEGVTVETTYGYDTITIISDGPVLTYGAFIIWVNGS